MAGQADKTNREGEREADKAWASESASEKGHGGSDEAASGKLSLPEEILEDSGRQVAKRGLEPCVVLCVHMRASQSEATSEIAMCVLGTRERGRVGRWREWIGRMGGGREREESWGPWRRERGPRETDGARGFETDGVNGFHESRLFGAEGESLHQHRRR